MIDAQLTHMYVKLDIHTRVEPTVLAIQDRPLVTRN